MVPYAAEGFMDGFAGPWTALSFQKNSGVWPEGTYQEKEMLMARKLGKRFVVEWCESMPKDENGDAILDTAKYVKEPFASMKAAQKRAGELIAARKDFFGCIRIEEQELAVDEDILEHEGPQVRGWRIVGEPHHVSSNDGSLDD